MAKNAAAETKVARAYTRLIAVHPFFATLLLRLRRVEDPSCEQMWTDGQTVGYNPDWIESLSHSEVVGALARIAIHNAGLHPWRRGGRDKEKWNAACEMVANYLVENAEMTLPPNALPGAGDLSPEEVYAQLPDNPGRSGGKGGKVASWVRDPEGSESDHEQQMNEMRIAVQQAIHAARQAGRLPSGLERWAEEVSEPIVPWTDILARFLDRIVHQDYNFMIPNRRYMGTGFMLPSLNNPSFGRVALGCDASGSIDMQQLCDICSEVLGLMDTYMSAGDTPELTICWFDTDVYPQTISDPSELNPVGGGGTSFSVVFDWFKKHPEATENVRAIVMVTDGHCTDFGEEPDLPVLWILTEKNPWFKPPFGEVVYVISENK